MNVKFTFHLAGRGSERRERGREQSSERKNTSDREYIHVYIGREV